MVWQASQFKGFWISYLIDYQSLLCGTNPWNKIRKSAVQHMHSHAHALPRTNTGVWREFSWKSVIRIFIAPAIKCRQQTTQQPCWGLCGDLKASHTNQTEAFPGQYECNPKRNHGLCHSKQLCCDVPIRTKHQPYVQRLWCHSLLCNSPWTLVSKLMR